MNTFYMVYILFSQLKWDSEFKSIHLNDRYVHFDNIQDINCDNAKSTYNETNKLHNKLYLNHNTGEGRRRDVVSSH